MTANIKYTQDKENKMCPLLPLPPKGRGDYHDTPIKDAGKKSWGYILLSWTNKKVQRGTKVERNKV